jgi:hypothetical protein
MTLKRRLDAVEAALTPTQLVLRWLAEAHAFGDIDAYVAAMLQESHPLPPLDRLAREAAAGARSAMKGKRPEIVDAAVRDALRETVFRYELVMRIYVMARELIDREALIDAALSAHVSLLTSEEPRPARYAERLGELRDLIAGRVSELRAVAEARSIVEKRYLDGHGALFPNVAAAWEEQLKSTTLIADMALRLAALDGVPDAEPPDPERISARTTQLVADLVQPAKSDALEKLGEGKRAFDIANDWLRTKFVVTPAVV